MKSMAKSIRDYTKKRRPPAPGTLVGVRLQPEPLRLLDAWAAKQDDHPSRPDAIRRLMEIGLSAPAEKIPRIIATGDALNAAADTAPLPRAKATYASVTAAATKAPRPRKAPQKRS
jgi:hypothetical protein